MQNQGISSSPLVCSFLKKKINTLRTSHPIPSQIWVQIQISLDHHTHPDSIEDKKVCGLSLDRCRLSPPFLRTFVNLSCRPEPFLHPAPCRPPSPPAPPDPSLITLSLSFCFLPTSSCPFLGNVTFEKPGARQDDSFQSCTQQASILSSQFQGVRSFLKMHPPYSLASPSLCRYIPRINLFSGSAACWHAD